MGVKVLHCCKQEKLWKVGIEGLFTHHGYAQNLYTDEHHPGGVCV